MDHALLLRQGATHWPQPDDLEPATLPHFDLCLLHAQGVGKKTRGLQHDCLLPRRVDNDRLIVE